MFGLEGFEASRFLAETWQKRPLLIRGAFAGWTNPLEPDELAGLACEADVQSRLVRHPQPGKWELENGPIEPERFETLGDCPWTLLVQSVDHHVAEVAAVLEPFRFIPDWRIDDVMVSYASDGGGVGPHFDQYDVFLIQGLGRRRWRVGERCDSSTPLLPHDGLRLLADFHPVEEWLLEPGDMLYVPPGFAHDGVAVGDDCMTYSVGFRAPSRGDLVSAFADHLLDTLDEDDRYTDPLLTDAAHPGEITADAVTRLHDMVTGALGDRAGFTAWVGAYLTSPRDDRIDWAPEAQVTVADLMASQAASHHFERNPACRFSFIRHAGDALTLFADGQAYPCSGPAAEIAERICADVRFALSSERMAHRDVSEMIVDLVNRGCLAFSDPD